MKTKSINRGNGTATFLREGQRVLLVARCGCAEGSNGAQYQRAYHGVELTHEETVALLAQHGEEREEPGDFLLYPLHITEYA